jgi:hypothetical protein
MTLDELKDRMWDDLPLVRKNLVGRDRVDDLVMVAVEQCPVEFIAHVDPGSGEEEVVSRAWGQSIKRGYCLLYGDDAEFGPIFWLLISPVLQMIVKRLLEWWWESPKHRVLMAGWKRRLRCD